MNALSHDEVMTLIRLAKKAAEVMEALCEDRAFDEQPFYKRLDYRRKARAFRDAHLLACGQVFRLTEGKPIVS
jgi:hypothetical protein